MKYLILLFLFLTLTGCKENPIPKPNAYLSLNYTKPSYKPLEHVAPYQFNISNKAIFYTEKNNWFTIHYPSLKADIQVTYQPINNNLQKLIIDAEKLTYKHTLKAERIEVHPFENKSKHVYARLFEVSGNAASAIQFQATDSLKHFLSGSLYFNVSPNYDSLLPAIAYLKKDIQQMIESLEWKTKN